MQAKRIAALLLLLALTWTMAIGIAEEKTLDAWYALVDDEMERLTLERGPFVEWTLEQKADFYLELYVKLGAEHGMDVEDKYIITTPVEGDISAAEAIEKATVALAAHGVTEDMMAQVKPIATFVVTGDPVNRRNPYWDIYFKPLDDNGDTMVEGTCHLTPDTGIVTLARFDVSDFATASYNTYGFFTDEDGQTIVYEN